MNILVMSDIHSEFHKDHGKSFVESLDPRGVDVLVLAGDVCVCAVSYDILRWLCDKFENVVYVLGNHEYYNASSRDDVVDCMLRLEMGNFHFLHNGVTVIKGQRFVGGTMWFRDDPLLAMKRSCLNDFSFIPGFENWVFEENRETVEFLYRCVKQGDVVVTHHAPSFNVCHPRWKNSPLQGFYVCDMESLVLDRGPTLWSFGHTHDSRDMQIGDTRVVCNPFGYIRDPNHRFDECKTITI